MEASDEGLIRQWVDGFVRDTGIAVPAERFIKPLLEERSFFLWEDDEPRSLYTDLDNPTSNSIYRKIGYAPVRDDLELVLVNA